MDTFTIEIACSNSIILTPFSMPSYDYGIYIDDETGYPLAYFKIVYAERRGNKSHQLERMIAEIYALKPSYEKAEGKKCIVKAVDKITPKRKEKPENKAQLKLFDEVG